jgi:hypothetical protein
VLLPAAGNGAAEVTLFSGLACALNPDFIG